MKTFLLVFILAIAASGCGRKPEPPSSTSTAEKDAAAARAAAAKRYDRQHDAAMEEATYGSLPEPRPAGPLK